MAKYLTTNKFLTFSVIYEAAPEGGYIAFAPSLPGCHSQGETLEETEKNIKEAIELYLESLKESKQKIPVQERILQGQIQVQI
ncbi:MAG: type II toxin-antitoxin system HicB family antitoxin [bacterium]|nr:type II toxin-antitoxin system HicB family antitoxin [bacterium]